MRIKQFIPILLLMILGGVSGAMAQSIEITPASGSYMSSSGNYVNTWTSSSETTPQVTIIASANNMDKRQTGDYFLWHSGSAQSSNYTMTIASGYIITGYTITAQANSSDQTVTANNQSQTFTSSQSSEFSVSGLENQGATFVLTGANTGLKVTKISITYQEGTSGNTLDPTASDIYTLNNTNSSRGALIYDPDQSTKWVWSSGKDGKFDDTSANSQWILMPTGTDGQYYLYNVGAQKFAIPVTGGTYTGYSWAFSSDAAALTLNQQADGTYKLKTASGDLFVSVSNNYEGPIINYDDIGAQFTITKVGDANSEVTTQMTNAVNKLIHNTTPLSAVPSEDGWYAVRIKTNATYPDYFVFAPEEEIDYNGTSYALNFYNEAKVRPAIDNATYYFRIAKDENGYDWQMPNGRYLYNNVNKFPVSTETATAITIDHSDSGFRFYHNNGSYTRYGVPYLLNNTYFIGETSSSGNAYYDIYPISLADAGLTAWQVKCDDAPASVQITCSRSDVSGLTSVYKNGYFFLPSGVTPEASDFFLPGGASTTVDATAHTITIAYNPDLAIVEEGVTVEQGWQTAARGEEVMLLRVTAAPFNAPTGVTMSVSLKDGAESNIAKLTLYEASSASPGILSTGTGAPTKTVVSEATVDGSTATFTIGDFSAGTHYYWIGATITEGAELGAVVDAAVTGITYTYNSKETTLDLTSVGDPSDRGAMVFNVRSYPFLPRDNGSRVYRIPAMVVADDGSIIAAADKRYDSYTDIGGGHVIDIVVRRSTDGGKTWGEPVIVAKGQGTADDAKCGYGDPSLTKGKDGKLYCLFAAGNTGYFYGLNRICMSTSEDNGVTWTEPVDLFETGRITDHTQYGLFDYFVTSGKGLYTNDGILMYLLPAQCYTDAAKTAHISNSNDYLFYSTDDGATWHIDTTPVYTGGDEAKLEQLADGTLIASVRQAGNRGFNTGTYTKNDNGTVTFNWSTQTTNTTLYQPYANNQGIFYYQREANTGKRDVIIHSMTTGQHANLKLYFSTDQGQSWTEFLNVQTKGARYVTLEKSGTDAEPGSLYLLFEDQSLNDAGGYTDYNHYPINFLEITRDQLKELIPVLDDPAEIEIIVEYKVIDGNGSEWASQVVRCETNNVAYAMPQSLKRAFCTYSYFSDATCTNEVAAIDDLATIYVKCAYAGPFEFSTKDNPKWYFMYAHKQNDENDYLAYADDSSYGVAAEAFINKYSDAAYHWAFIGNPYAVKVMNRSNNGYLATSTLPTTNNTALTETAVSSDEKTYPYNTFSLYGFSNQYIVADNPFHLSLNDQAGVFVNGGNGNLYYHNAVIPNEELKVTNWKDAYVMAKEVPTKYPVALNAVGEASYATLYLPFDAKTDDVTKAYYVETVADGIATLTELSEGKIPAKTAVVLINNSAETNVTFGVENGLAAVIGEDANLLKGTLVPMELDLSQESPNYSMGRKDGNIGFYKFNNNGTTTITLGANKAYLQVPAAESSAKGFTFSFGDPSGITVFGKKSASDAFLQGSEHIYDLGGRRISVFSVLPKGIYIVGGKKVVVK